MDMFGGCEGNKLAMGVAAIMVVVAILIVWYVYMFMQDAGILLPEGFCGELDQGCCCGGNEKMTVREISNNDLSKVLSGR
jgi:hypothetical protein